MKVIHFRREPFHNKTKLTIVDLLENNSLNQLTDDLNSLSWVDQKVELVCHFRSVQLKNSGMIWLSTQKIISLTLGSRYKFSLRR